MLDVAFGYPCGEEVLEARIGQLDYDCVVDRGFLCQNNCHYQISIIQNHKTVTPLYSNDCFGWILARLGPRPGAWQRVIARGMRCLAAIDCVEQESDKSANFIDKCEKTDRTEPWNLKLFQLNKISCFGESQQTKSAADRHSESICDW